MPECKNLDSNFKNPNIPLLSNINNILCFIFCDTSFWLLAFCMPTIVELHSLINGGYKLFNIFSTLSRSTLFNFVDTFRRIWYSFYFIFLLYVIYYSIWSFVFCLWRKPHPSNYFNSSIKQKKGKSISPRYPANLFISKNKEKEEGKWKVWGQSCSHFTYWMHNDHR